MASRYSTASLLSAIKANISVPEFQSRFTDNNLLAFADEFISSELVPALVNLNVELFIVSDDVPVISGQKKYLIPNRAISRSLRSVRWNEGRFLGYANPEDSFMHNNVVGEPQVVSFIGDYFLPQPIPSTGTLNIAYACLVSKLVKESNCIKVSTFNLNNNIIQAVSIPSSFEVGTICDLVSQDGRIIARDISITDITSPNITVSALSNEIKAGDFLCVAQESCILTLPLEVIPAIVKKVCCKILSSQTDSEAFGICNAEFNQIWTMCKTAMSPKLVNQTPKIKPSPFLRSQKVRNWR